MKFLSLGDAHFIFVLFQDDNLQRCSFSADSQMGHSESDESSDDENLDMKDSAYHDTENEDPPEVYDDPDRVLSGKFSGSSGYAGNDLYSYKVLKLSIFFCRVIVYLFIFCKHNFC